MTTSTLDVGREMTAVVTALSAPTVQKRSAPFVELSPDWLDVAGLRRASRNWTTAERTLVEVAIACWDGTGRVDFAGLMSLDERNARRVLTALAVHLGLLDHADRISLDLAEVLS